MSRSVVSYYCFGNDENLLEDEDKASVQRNNMSELLQGVKATLHLPWIFDILNMIPFPIAKHIMPPGALDMALISQVCSIRGVFEVFELIEFLIGYSERSPKSFARHWKH
jgi:hypothetical protein